MHTENLPSKIVQTKPCKKGGGNISKLSVTITRSHKQANKRKATVIKITISQRISNQRIPHLTIVKADKKAIKNLQNPNFVDSKQVISRLKASKKSKSNRKDDGASPTRHANKYNKMLSAEEIDFHIWFE